MLFPIYLLGQRVSLLPTHFPKNIYGTWINNKTDISLIITPEYIVIQNELYGYNEIVKEQNSLDFTCVNNYNNDIKYININILDSNNIVLDEGYKISKLTKLNHNFSKIIPSILRDFWFNDNSKIELTKNKILFKDQSYNVDYVASSNKFNYQIIIYNNSEYTLLHNYINDHGHFLNANFLKTEVYKKATFYQTHKRKILVFILLFSLTIGYFLVQWKINISKKREVNKRLMVEMQLKSIRSQMNPHFLFNALSAIQNLINRGDNEKANHYLTEFSQLMRLTLDKSEKGLVPLDDEIKSIKKYLEIEKLRFSFDYKIEVDQNINSQEIEIPAMLIQPIVENAIIHGLHQKEGTKNLWIEFKIKNHHLICTVTDNGVGIHKTHQKDGVDLNRQKYGLKLAKDRIKLINESYQTQGKISMVDLSDKNADETGTQVIISMPIKY
ncbi:hypothetical protein AXE80_13475 [Wenyingzhuangia fucanilytica]|uniref:Uncharacterized protein n=2 Tax=Wenyingzhuangia fucanilytica TaxID=1790137 RepID=A0A1B1Y947_9FLAO|nr:hypothetical protein AXE80_13475 [Wenyingzhuangia fucanilytica]